MSKPEEGDGRATAFADPVIDRIRGTGPRPAARPAPGCPLRAIALDAETEDANETSGDAQ